MHIVEVSASASSSVLKGIGAVCRRVIDMMPQPAASSSSSDAPPALMLIASSCVVDPVGSKEAVAVATAEASGDAVMFVTVIGRVVQVRTCSYSLAPNRLIYS